MLPVYAYRRSRYVYPTRLPMGRLRLRWFQTAILPVLTRDYRATYAEGITAKRSAA